MRQMRASLSAVAIALVVASSLRGDTIEVIVHEVTGQIFLRNPGPNDFGITAYSIVSPTNSLSSVSWNSIADNFDASGDRSVDVDDEWVELTEFGSTSDLSEAEFDGDGGLLVPGQAVNLGLAWNPLSPQNLTAEVTQTDQTFATVLLDYRTLPGDYNNNLEVEELDYTVWLNTFGSTTNLTADGNNNGVVDAADFTMWRDNLGATFLESVTVGSALATLTPIPEPSAVVLWLVIAGWPARWRVRISR